MKEKTMNISQRFGGGMLPMTGGQQSGSSGNQNALERVLNLLMQLLGVGGGGGGNQPCQHNKEENGHSNHHTPQQTQNPQTVVNMFIDTSPNS
jgi:hypothetical protein